VGGGRPRTRLTRDTLRRKTRELGGPRVPSHMFAIPVVVTRIAVALAQGLLLAWLYDAQETKSWPATEPLLFAPLVAVTVLVPVPIVVGLGNLRGRTLLIWTVAAAVLAAGLAWYDIWRDPLNVAQVRNLPSAPLWFALVAMFFITHSLITAGEADRRFIATYPRHFDIAWKQGLQACLAALFVVVFWGLYWLGTELFRLIKLEFLADLAKHRWFTAPVTTITFAAALHLTDVRAGIINGARNLALTLLSWLLPMMALLALGFLVALPFTGLGPLWATRHATAILIAAAAALVLLINTAYRSGDGDDAVTGILRYATIGAIIALVPLVALAGYAMALRVQQHGWTPPRIYAVACIAGAACYMLGYLVALMRSGRALRGIATTNVATAFVILAALIALFSPIADPARISVADQIARFEAGRVTPEQFDLAFLRFQSGRYGDEALKRLKEKRGSPEAERLVQRANEALAWRDRAQAQRQQRDAFRATAATRTANITLVHPKGQPLPVGFAETNWDAAPRQWSLPRCLTGAEKCEAILLDLDDDGRPEVLLFGLPSGAALAFKSDGEKWKELGTIQNGNCSGVRDALRSGQFQAVAPTTKEIEVAGQRVRITSGCQ
jgi:Domain of unknown function (DUF4153)